MHRTVKSHIYKQSECQTSNCIKNVCFLYGKHIKNANGTHLFSNHSIRKCAFIAWVVVRHKIRWNARCIYYNNCAFELLQPRNFEVLAIPSHLKLDIFSILTSSFRCILESLNSAQHCRSWVSFEYLRFEARAGPC